MKKVLSFLLTAAIFLAMGVYASAESAEPAQASDDSTVLPRKNPIYELYSADGFYTDSIGNEETYSFHVPQIFADSPDAVEINAEIAENFGERVETMFQNMERGTSLWSWHTEWHAYWNGNQLFLLVSADQSGDCDEYAAYGYDFETDSRVTNEMILEQRGISEEVYLENLKEAVQSKYEALHSNYPADKLAESDYGELLERTLEWQTLEEPMYIDQFGEIETIALIGSMAGAGRYYHLVRPFEHRINIIGDRGMVESSPETAKAGETVTIRLYDVTDGDLEIAADDVEGTRIDWLEYQFAMPAHDVDVKVEFIGNGLA